MKFQNYVEYGDDIHKVTGRPYGAEAEKEDPLPWSDLSEIKKLDSFKDLLRMGFRLVSTPRQLAHGTLQFAHPKGAGDKYQNLFHVTTLGYVRRLVSGPPRYGQKKIEMYPINARDPKYGKLVKTIEGVDHNLKVLVKYLSSKEHYSYTPQKFPEPFEMNIKVIPHKTGPKVEATLDGNTYTFGLDHFSRYLKKKSKGL